MIIGYAYVVGDIVHKGHIVYLNKCAKFCDRLMVGVLTDKACMEKKPRPILNFRERAYVIKNLKAVDYVVKQDDYSPLNNCKKVKPDILFESTSHSEMPANEYMESKGRRVMIMPYYKRQSSTRIKEKISDRH